MNNEMKDIDQMPKKNPLSFQIDLQKFEKATDEENKDEASAVDTQTGEKIEAEVVDEDDVEIPTQDAETKEKIIYYVTDLVQQSQYVNMFKKAKMDLSVHGNHNDCLSLHRFLCFDGKC